MKKALSSLSSNFQDFLKSSGVEGKVTELPNSTRASPEAASAIGCEVAEIAKSLIFYVKETNLPLVAVMSGANRMDEKKKFK